MKLAQYHKAVVWSLLFFLIGICLFLRWQWSFVGLYGQDAHEYLRYTAALKQWLIGGDHPGTFFWPLGYPMLGGLLSFMPPLATVDGLQLTSLLSHWLATILLIRLLTKVFPDDSSKMGLLWVVLAYFLSPHLLRAGLLVMSDALSILGVVGCYYFYFSYQEKARRSMIAGMLCGAALAVSTRYATFLLILAPVTHLLWLSIRSRQWGALLGGLALSSVFFLPHLILRWDDPLGFLDHQFMGSWSAGNLWQDTFASTTGKFQYRFFNIIYSFYHWFHPAFLFLGILLLPFVKHWWPRTLPLRLTLLSILIYSLFLAGIPFQNHRFLLPAFPLVVIILYPAFQYLSTYTIHIPKLLKVLLVIGLAIMQLSLFTYSMKSLIASNQVEQVMAFRLKAYPSNDLYTFYYDLALGSYQVPHRITNLWQAKQVSCQEGALILFHPTQFNTQWQGHRLIKNWEKLQSCCQLKVLEDMPQGWRLYQIRGGLDE